MWDVATGKELHKRGVKTVGRSISLSFSGNLIAYTSTKVSMNPSELTVADIRDPSHMEGQDSAFCIGLDQNSHCCTFTHMDDTVVVGTTNGRLNQYDLRNTAECVNFSDAHSGPIQDLQLSRDEGLLISASADKSAKLHDARTLNTLKTYR